METNFRNYKPALERQIQSWFWLNDKMRPFIISLDRLIEVDGSDGGDIFINLHALNDLYTDRFFRKQLTEVAPKLIDQILKPGLAEFLKVVGWESFLFSIKVKIGGELYEKLLRVKNPDFE
ncbi:hypothetical protein [Pedobacter nototheniae]|uniref:hypothetical protein n=1 Tax=Pedobacter nototheniae TaxID=2488994 RepID=UPI001038686B|nr:hypothetical protein [Pedobacter nototheniae]